MGRFGAHSNLPSSLPGQEESRHQGTEPEPCLGPKVNSAWTLRFWGLEGQPQRVTDQRLLWGFSLPSVHVEDSHRTKKD